MAIIGIILFFSLLFLAGCVTREYAYDNLSNLNQAPANYSPSWFTENSGFDQQPACYKDEQEPDIIVIDPDGTRRGYLFKCPGDIDP